MNSFHFLLARGENENTRNGLIKTRVAATFERVSPSVLETRRGDGIRRIEPNVSLNAEDEKCRGSTP